MRPRIQRPLAVTKMKFAPSACRRIDEMPPNSACEEVSDSPPRKVSGPKRTRCGSRGSNAPIGRAVTSILVGGWGSRDSGSAGAEGAESKARAIAAMSFRGRPRRRPGMTDCNNLVQPLARDADRLRLGRLLLEQLGELFGHHA